MAATEIRAGRLAADGRRARRRVPAAPWRAGFLAPVFALGASIPLLLAAAEPRLILISCDGLRVDAITPEHAPTLMALRAAGTSAERCINDLPSATLPNHATMLTGVTSDRHLVRIDFEVPGTLSVPTLHDYAARAGKRTAFFACKDKLRMLAKPKSTETIVFNGDQNAVVEQFLRQLEPGGPDVLFLHLRDPDSTGHRFGWDSPEYNAAVRRDDDAIRRIWDAVRAGAAAPEPAGGAAELASATEPAAGARPTYLIVTADHGGQGTTHFINLEQNRLIPWIVVGPGIPAGATLAGEMSTADTLPTALWLLGLPVPPDLSGKAQTRLKATPPSADGDASSVPAIGPPCVLFSAPAALLVFGLMRRAGRRRPSSTP